MHEVDELPGAAEPWVDGVVIGDVVPVVTVRRLLERRQPEGVDAEALEVIEAVAEAREVSASVAVRVHERLHPQRVDNGVAIPEVGGHACTRLPRRA